MQQRELEIINKLGLHARASAKLTQLAALQRAKASAEEVLHPPGTTTQLRGPPELARAWIYARLIVAIIAEQIAGQVPDSSPSGPDNTTRKPFALASHEDSPSHHLRRHPWTTPVADPLQPLHPNPPSPL